MKHLAAKYETMFGRKPRGFVMGIKDWYVLKNEMSQMSKLPVGGCYAFIGLPIHLKATSGIELLMDEDACLQILKTSGQERLKLIKGSIVT